MPTVSARFNEQTLNDYSPLKDIKNVVKNLNKIVKEPLPKSDNNNILQISDCYISLGKYNTKLFMTFFQDTIKLSHQINVLNQQLESKMNKSYSIGYPKIKKLLDEIDRHSQLDESKQREVDQILDRDSQDILDIKTKINQLE